MAYYLLKTMIYLSFELNIFGEEFSVGCVRRSLLIILPGTMLFLVSKLNLLL